MIQINRESIKKGGFPPDVQVPELKGGPETVIQFGEGNFLRGFVNWMFNKMRQKGIYKGMTAIVQPLERGLIDMINEQKGLYTLFLRGIQNDEVVQEKEIIESVSRGINPYSNFDDFIACASNPDLRVVISNTTEAGISHDPADSFQNTPPTSFPGKLTRFLYERFRQFEGAADKGLIFLPCELIDRNGDNLKRIVLQLASEWKLGENFAAWISSSNYFLNTLVDRIVTGYPFDKIDEYTEELGYTDKILDTGEIFHLWVIERPADIADMIERELPFRDAGLNVIWTEDMSPYRTRKVRILNGAHTMTVLGAYLAGLNTVKECLDTPLVKEYIRKGLFEEIMPTLDLDSSELEEYAGAVLERFANPFIKHFLLSISLNSVSKFKTRVLPSIEGYIECKGKAPEVLSFSMAALISFYQGTGIHNGALLGTRSGETYRICDNEDVLRFFLETWSSYDGTEEGAVALVKKILGNTAFWGKDLNDLPGLADTVCRHLNAIRTNGMRPAMESLNGGKM